MIIIIDLESERARRKTRAPARRFASIPEAVAAIDANPFACGELRNTLDQVLCESELDQAPIILMALLALLDRIDRRYATRREAKALIAHYLTAFNEQDECHHDDAS